MAGNVVVYDQGAQGDVRWVRFACTGDASDGSFPTVDLAGYGVAGTVIAIQTEPGGTAPTAAYDVAVVNSAGVDILGGRALNRSASDDEVVRVSGLALPRDTNTLTITGNVVPEAELKVAVIWTPAASALPVDADGAVPTHDADVLAQVEAIAGAVHMEDDPHVSTDKGFSVLVVANEAGVQMVSADGDYSTPASDLAGRLLFAAIRDDALSTVAEPEGSGTVLRVDANGALWTQMAGALDPATDAVAIGASASHGASIFRSLDLDESEEDVKVSPGTVYSLTLTNLATSLRYVKLWNATAADVSVGTTTPVMTIPLKPAAASGAETLHIEFPTGIEFDTAISIGATTGLADNNTGAPGANEVVANVSFK